MARIDPVFVRQQIELLERRNPELREDDETWALAIDEWTDATECLSELVTRLDDTAALAGGVVGRIAELESRLTRFELRQRALRMLIQKIMDAAGLTKIELPLATLSVRSGSVRVVINDEASVPDILCRIKREPDKTKIKEHLSSGVTCNWAALEQGEPSLAIRIK